MGTISEREFLASLERETPAVELPPLLQAIRHGLRGEWEPAHRIAQTVDDADGASVDHRVAMGDARRGNPASAGIDSTSARCGRRTDIRRVLPCHTRIDRRRRCPRRSRVSMFAPDCISW